jgi:Zn-dependent protease with chaperone function
MNAPRTSFTGTVFPPGQTRQVVCDLYLRPEGLVAVPREGDELLLPYDRMRLQRGGVDLTTIVCLGEPGEPAMSCADRAFPDALATCGGRRVAEALDGMRRQDKARRGLKLGCLAIALLTLIGIGVGGWLAVSHGSRMLVGAIPISVDKTIGEQAIQTMDLGGPVVKTPDVERFVQTVVDRLDDHVVPPGADPADFAHTFTVRVVESDLINAFALPGGQIVVFTGLIKGASRAEQVAGVLGHEIAHVTKRHGVNGLIRAAGIAIAAQLVLGDVSGIAAVLGQGAMVAVLNGYSRDQEREADQEGARIAAAAGFDPAGLAEFFLALKDQPGSQMPGILQVFSTHPDHDERIAAIRALGPTLTVAPGEDLNPLFRAAQDALGVRARSASAGVTAPVIPVESAP